MSIPDRGRRRALAAVAAWPFTTGAAPAALGLVRPPQPVPALRFIAAAGGPPRRFADLLGGGVVAVQLMFTGCSSVCPLQGAQFEAVQAGLSGNGRSHRLLSLSVDPLADGAPQLSRWLARWRADPRVWTAAAPLPDELPALLRYLRGQTSAPDVHPAQVFVFSRRAELVFRTAALPDARALIRLLDEAAA